MSEQSEPAIDRVISLHTEIGREGAILEIRPEGQDYPSESDMSHLSDAEVRHLRDELNSYLRELGVDPETDCPYCEDGEMYREGSKVICDTCEGVKLA